LRSVRVGHLGGADAPAAALIRRRSGNTTIRYKLVWIKSMGDTNVFVISVIS